MSRNSPSKTIFNNESSGLFKPRQLGLKELMPALQNKIYFNYGGQGPIPNPALESIFRSWEKIQELGPFTNKVWPYIANEIIETKKDLSKICGVEHSRIALTENVTSGCVYPLWGLPFKKGERILISDCEHPGVVAACKEIALRKELNIDILKVRQLRRGIENSQETEFEVIQALKNSLHKNTKLVVISHVLWNTGQLIPISVISNTLKKHPSKPYLLVDAAQSFGQIPIAQACQNSDIYAFTGHKWACGPEGLGGVVLSDRIILESKPTLIGWRSLQKEVSIYEEGITQFHTDGRRFEVATSCIPLLSGLRCSLKLLNEEDSVSQRLIKIQKLSRYLWDGLNEMKNVKTVLNGAPPCGLVSFHLLNQEADNKLVSDLGKQDIWIRILEDPAWLRACVHVTTNQSEISELIRAIGQIV